MKKNNILILTLVTTIIMVTSTISVSSTSPQQSNMESLEVVKEIYDNKEWVNEINADIDDIIVFRITVTYHNLTQPGSPHWADYIEVVDSLPPCLKYKTGSAEPFEPDISLSGKRLEWDLPDQLADGESVNITFNTTVVSYGENINYAGATAKEICTGMTISGEDTAKVYVQMPQPEIEVQKKVFDGTCNWVEEIYAEHCSTVRFNITVKNKGNCDLFGLYINDTLPESLEFDNNVYTSDLPDDFEVDGKDISWYYTMFPEGEIIYIEFDAHVIGEPCSIDVNWVDVNAKTECCQEVSDSDDAIVKVKGMCMEKQVWDDTSDSWEDETSAQVGSVVKFRIKIEYWGTLSLKQIKVRDELPECLGYVEDSSNPEEPEISSDGKTLWWNLTSLILYHKDTLIIEFESRVFSNNCEQCVNLANVTASECGIKTVYAEDTATVTVECGFDADAGGPYSGEVDENIQIHGSANDGKPPYLFEWDLDGDGIYDDATGEDVIWSWDEPGNYLIYLLVTDEEEDTAGAYASVEIGLGENIEPNKPTITVDGNKNKLKAGKEYTFYFTSTDPDGDNIWYYIDWGDGDTEEWIGPYGSAEQVGVNHSFSNSQTSYNIRAKAKDEFDQESSWGNLNVATPKSKIIRNPALYNIIQRLVQIFPILQIFLNL